MKKLAVGHGEYTMIEEKALLFGRWVFVVAVRRGQSEQW